jgi:hypothetical protein
LAVGFLVEIKCCRMSRTVITTTSGCFWFTFFRAYSTYIILETAEVHPVSSTTVFESQVVPEKTDSSR